MKAIYILCVCAFIAVLKVSAQDLFPDGTPVPEWFRDNRAIDINSLGKHYRLTDYGLSTDSTEVQTGKIQAVIDKAELEGGGVIIIPKGTFLSGSLFFKPGTHLHLEEGAVLKGSDDISHFPIIMTRMEGQTLKYFAALVNADGVDGFTLSGRGTVNGNGLRYWKAFWLRREFNPQCTNMDEMRPRLLYISNSRNVRLSGVSLINSPFWTTHLYKCENVKLQNLHIFSPDRPVKAPSTDAVDIDACTNVHIKSCYMSVNDDAVALKGGKGPTADSDPNNGGNRNIIIEDCTYGFCHSALTCGSESIHNRNIIFRRSTVDSAQRLLWLKMRPDTPQRYEYILVEDISGNAANFLYIHPWTQFFDLKGHPAPLPSSAGNITMRNIKLDCITFMNVEQSEQYRLSDFTFENLNIRADKSPEVHTGYIDNFRLKNISVNGDAISSTPALLFETGGTTFIYVDKTEREVVHTAVALLQKDVGAVFNAKLLRTDDRRKAHIVVVSSAQLQGRPEAFSLATQGQPGKEQLIISGSDARGKAYGILELSRMTGVSPWHYFADLVPEKRGSSGFPAATVEQSPSVRYRGIFLNDEDWGLLPWATNKFKYGLKDNMPLSANRQWKGAVGAEAYEKIFELMLRLRANTVWPAMHECTVPFYFVQGNRRMPDKYGIIVGSSHCEPLARNSASEWDLSGKGDYNFVGNRKNILAYWAERLQELRDSENIFTVGMRGKHDGIMQGVATLAEHKQALSQIIPAQQELLRKYINHRPEHIPQAFIPYKEVLEVYDDGLEVPEHVTLVWCDDNYGYIRRLPNEKEQARSGGSGVYYHVSYWGRPHDYLWLASTSPALVYTEMKRAYDQGADRLWILNVGDIKPAEYLTEFFLDLAWDIQAVPDGRSVFSHLAQWAKREFGEQQSAAISAVMKEYYRLANIRKPEFMGWSRVEEGGYPKGLTPVGDSGYNPEFKGELQRRIADYLSLEKQVAAIASNISDSRSSSFFQLIEYPARGASLMNQKWLYAQLSRFYSRRDIASAKECAAKSLAAYHEIESITNRYNQMESGKWQGIMDAGPRNLPVFAQPAFPHLDTLLYSGDKTLLPEGKAEALLPFVIAQNAAMAINLEGKGRMVEGLGHSFAAIQMQKDSLLAFTFRIPAAGAYWIKIATLPNHDVDGRGMKIALLADGREIQTWDYRALGRSETWKENVLRGQAISEVSHTFLHAGTVQLAVKALTPYVILDQIMIGQGSERFYEFPFFAASPAM